MVDDRFDLRFNPDADTIDEAKHYIYNRATQLLKYNVALISIEEYEWGVLALFDCLDKGLNIIPMRAIYLLEGYRGKGLYKKLALQYYPDLRIVTHKDCGLARVLAYFELDAQEGGPFEDRDSYKIINSYFANTRSKRSREFLMDHIEEGVFILDMAGASIEALDAFCIHPMLQDDKLLETNMPLLKGLEPKVIVLAMEYRAVANAYLSTRSIQSIEEIQLSPIKDVNLMLAADKLQNRKGFDCYHKNTHPRSKELDVYFNNWFNKLDITPRDYNCILSNLLKPWW
jgi:hypothetical protein